MTPYSDNDLAEDWEFKIVRSMSGAFRRPDKIEQVVAEESEAGWVLVEKFDDNRLRFKRPASARRNDYNLPTYINPYRTAFGMSEGAVASIIIGVVVSLIGLIALLVWLLG